MASWRATPSSGSTLGSPGPRVIPRAASDDALFERAVSTFREKGDVRRGVGEPLGLRRGAQADPAVQDRGRRVAHGDGRGLRRERRRARRRRCRELERARALNDFVCRCGCTRKPNIMNASLRSRGLARSVCSCAPASPGSGRSRSCSRATRFWIFSPSSSRPTCPGRPTSTGPPAACGCEGEERGESCGRARAKGALPPWWRRRGCSGAAVPPAPPSQAVPPRGRAGGRSALVRGIVLRRDLQVGEHDAVDAELVAVDARDRGRAVDEHAVVVDDVDDGAELARVRAVGDDRDAADLDKPLEAHG